MHGATLPGGILVAQMVHDHQPEHHRWRAGRCDGPQADPHDADAVAVADHDWSLQIKMQWKRLSRVDWNKTLTIHFDKDRCTAGGVSLPDVAAPSVNGGWVPSAPGREAGSKVTNVTFVRWGRARNRDQGGATVGVDGASRSITRRRIRMSRSSTIAGAPPTVVGVAHVEVASARERERRPGTFVATFRRLALGSAGR